MNSDYRKTLAVMFTDVAGFTGHMERNEAEALEMISLIRENLIPLLEHHSGTLVKEMGDGTLSVFENSRDAVRCSRALQETLSGRTFSLRIGIHRGSVYLCPGDVLGDTVNVASRLEKMAPPGGICISGELLEGMGGGRKPAVHSLGLQQLKGLGRLIDLYTVMGCAKHPLPCYREDTEESGSLIRLVGEVPSVAVMPLSNLGAPGDEFYAHGISADIVSQLAAAGGIAVAPLNDVIKLRKVVSSGADIASRLSARFFVMGSLLRRGKRFQLSVELHDLQMRKLVWTDSWTDDWFELPSIKVKVADSLLKAFGIHRAVPGPEEGGSLSYELYLQASEIYRRKKSFSDVEEARGLLVKALSMDPDMIAARILLGISFADSGDFKRAGEELDRAYETAQYTGDRSGHLHALNWIGINQWRQSDFRAAKHTFQRAMMLARTMGELQVEARSLGNIGLIECNLGDYHRALEHFQQSLEVPGVSSMGNLKANTLCNIGLTHWHTGDNVSALEFYTKALRIFEKLENLDGQANMCMNIGVVTRNMGHFQESLRYTTQALELNRKLGDRQGESRTMVGIGNCHRFVGMYQNALESYITALETAIDIGDRITESICKTNIAEVRHATGMYSEAEKLYMDALNICTEIGDREGEGENLASLGSLSIETGDTDKAAELLERAIAILHDISAETRSIVPRIHLAGLCLDRDESAESLRHLKTAEKFVHPDMDDFIKANQMLSNMYLRLSESASFRSNEDSRRKSREFLETAYNSLMETADSIDERTMKESFLRIETHRKIIDSYESSVQELSACPASALESSDL